MRITDTVTSDMRDHSTFNAQAATLRCEVCRTPLTPLDSTPFDATPRSSSTYSICRSFDCKRVMDQKTTMEPTLFKHHLAFQCKLIQQRQEKENSHKQHVAGIKLKERNENQEIFTKTLASAPLLSKNTLQLIPIPSGISTLTKLPEERRNRYIDHLKNVIEKASTYTHASEVPPDQHHDAYEKLALNERSFKQSPLLQATCDSMCAMCKGGCCADGKEHAYISPVIIRRQMDANPELQKEDILATYTANIAPESAQNACINQTKTGCALPRTLRADICNSYFCGPISTYIKNMESVEILKPVLAIQRSNHAWNRFDTSKPNNVVDVRLIESDQIQ